MGMSRCWRPLESNAEYAAIKRQYGEKTARATALGQAISYRFKRDAKGWRVFATTEMMDVVGVTDQRRGAIGVDVNADHLAVVETDASGNYVNAWRAPLVTYGKSRPSGRGPDWGCRGQRGGIRQGSWQAHRDRAVWTSGRRRHCWRASPAGTAGCCPVSVMARSRRTSCPAVTDREWSYIR